MVGPDLSGAVLDGRYQLISLMGAGGMGQVYEGTHLALDRRVAIKVLPSQLSEDSRFRARFAREARAAAKISHRNVVQIMDFGESSDGPVYFVMEFLEGRDLGALLRESGRLSWARARHFLLQATSAIKAAHTHGIIHRDIKPGNCFVLDLPLEGLTDVVKLLDFGIAKVVAEAEKEGSTLLKPLTVTGEMMGTASYMSPEQARCESMDARSDVYSLGIMAYEMLTGRVPFTGINPVHVATRHIFDRPEPLHRAVPDILPEVEGIVLRALAKEPEQRFQTMAELEAALKAVPQEVSIESVPTRVLSALGSVGRRASVGTASNPIVALPDPETKVEPRVSEDSFEDAETPDPLVLLRRFGEPYPLRPRANDEPVEPPVGVEDDASADELAEVDEVTSARIRLVPEPLPGGTEVVTSIHELVEAVEAVPAASPPLDGVSSVPVIVAAPVPEPSMDRFEDWSMSRLDPEVDAASQSLEESVHRRERSKAWAVVFGLVLVLGGSAAIAKLAMSRSGAVAAAGAVADGEAVESMEPVEPPPTPRRVRAVVPSASPDEGAPAKSAERKSAEERKEAHIPAKGERVVQAIAPSSVEPKEPVANVDGPVAHAAKPETSTKPAEAGVARPSKQKSHDAKACENHRGRAYEADEKSDFRQLIKLTAPGPCWPPHLKLKRLKMLQTAFLETKQFARCVEVGRGVTDPDIQRAVKICEKQLH